MIFGLFLFNINALFTGERKLKNPWTFLLYLTNQGQVISGNTTNWLNQICSNTETLKEGGIQSFNMVPRWRSKWNLIGRAAIFFNWIQLNIQDFILAYFKGKSKNMDSFTFYLLSVVLVLTFFVATPTTGKEQLYHSFENVKLEYFSRRKCYPFYLKKFFYSKELSNN